MRVVGIKPEQEPLQVTPGSAHAVRAGDLLVVIGDRTALDGVAQRIGQATMSAR